MCKVYAICNQKGGCSKTSVTLNLGIGLAMEGKRVALIDADPQGSLTISLGYPDPDELPITLATIMTNIIEENEMPDNYGMLHHQEGIELIPANMELSGAEIELLDLEDRENVLKKALQEIAESYDFILIDCPPSLSLLTINAFTAADGVMIPIQCEYYAMEGLTQMMKSIRLVRKRLNPDLKVDGIVFTMYDARNNLSQQVVDSVKEALTEHIYETIIPRNVRVAEAPSYGMPVTEYDPHSAGAENYRKLAAELIRMGGEY